MGWESTVNNMRGNITDLLALRNQKRENRMGRLERGLGGITNALAQNRKYKEDAAAASQQNAWAMAAAEAERGFGGAENEADRAARMAELLERLKAEDERARLNRQNQIDVANLYQQDDEEKFYPTSLPWIMSQWDTFSGMLGIDGTDEYGNPLPDPTNEDYKTFRTWIKTLLSEEKYPEAERQEALNNLSEYLSDKYIITPGGGGGERDDIEDVPSDSGIDWNAVDNANELFPGITPRGKPINKIEGISSQSADELFPGQTYPERQPIIDENDLSDLSFEDFRGGEPDIPEAEIDIKEKEKKAYQKILEYVEKYGEHPDLMEQKELFEGQGAPLFATEQSLLGRINRIIDRIGG